MSCPQMLQGSGGCGRGRSAGRGPRCVGVGGLAGALPALGVALAPHVHSPETPGAHAGCGDSLSSLAGSPRP